MYTSCTVIDRNSLTIKTYINNGDRKNPCSAQQKACNDINYAYEAMKFLLHKK